MEMLIGAIASSALFLGLGLLTRHRVGGACRCGEGECLRESFESAEFEVECFAGSEENGRCRT